MDAVAINSNFSRFKGADFSTKMMAVRTLASQEFPDSHYGYASTLADCKRISYVNCGDGTRTFAMQGLNRNISLGGTNGEEFDCFESSVIACSWFKQIGVNASIRSSEIGPFSNHIFLYMPSRGFFGVTPFDRTLSSYRGRNPHTITEPSIKKYLINWQHNVILNRLTPMRWESMGARAVLVAGGLELLPGNNVGNDLTIYFSIKALSGRKEIMSYDHRLNMKQENLVFLKQVTKMHGPLGVFDVCKAQKSFVHVEETGDLDEPVIIRQKAKHQAILYNIIQKIDEESLVYDTRG